MTKKRALYLGPSIFGAAGEGASVLCLDWHELGKLESARDFDVVVVDIPERGEVEARHLSRFAELFNLSTMVDLLKSRCQLFFVGDPRLEIPWKPGPNVIPGPIVELAGIQTTWLGEPGLRLDMGMEARYSPLQEVLSEIRSYSYSLETWSPAKHLQAEYSRRAKQPEERGRFLGTGVRNLLVTRTGHAVAFQVWYEARLEGKAAIPMAGRVEFLPRLGASREESAQRLVGKIVGVSAQAQEPEWISEISMPGEEEFASRQEKLVEQREKLEVDLTELQVARSKLRSPLGLLYESGPVLEALVRNALEELGARVELPTSPGEEDGWITVEIDGTTVHGVLEIGGTRGHSHGEDRIRQLVDWVDKGMDLKGDRTKGIFIGNSSNTLPVKDRPFPFANQWIRKAQRWGFSAVRAEDLFEMILEARRGRLDRQRIWRAIFETAGPVAIEQLCARGAGEHSEV